MRKGLGIGVLVVGLAVLGLWSRANHAHRMQDSVSTAAMAAVQGSVHGVQAEVRGRDIHVSGIADSDAERSTLLAALDAVAGRRVVIDDLVVLPAAQPFATTIRKSDSGLAISGHVPTEALRGDLTAVVGPSAADMVLASGAPAKWRDLVQGGVAALAPLMTGEAAISDGVLTVTGQALSPAERDQMQAALASLPQDAVKTDITLLDDGTPVAYTLDFNASTGGTLSGKLPKGLGLDAIAKALGLASLAGDAKSALIGDDTADTGLFAKLAKWLPEMETLKVSVAPDATTVDAGLAPGADLAAVTAALTADLGAGVALTVADAAITGTDGAERMNAATGGKERFAGGFWLPVAEFDVGLPTCQAQADQVLAAGQVNFVSGSDELDATALRVLNRLASVIAPCAAAGMKAEIGGHTDSSGDAAANVGLSQKRAIAVRLALITRGVPQAMLRAQGYGAAQPIADNTTDEGKALNRRTTITWSE